MVMRAHHAEAIGGALHGALNQLVRGKRLWVCSRSFAKDCLRSCLCTAMCARPPDKRGAPTALAYEMWRNGCRLSWITVLGMVAEMELGFIKERQRAGIEAAKAKGVYKGRPVKFDRARIIELRKQGMGATEIAKAVGCKRGAVYLALKAAA